MATQAWAVQGGTFRDDSLNAVAIGSDGSSVVAGYSNGTVGSTASLGNQWFAEKLDADGNSLWKWEVGNEAYGDDRLFAAVMAEDGSVVFAGFSAGDFHVARYGADADGTWVSYFQDGTDYSDYAYGMAMGDDGSVVVTGVTLGTWGAAYNGGGDMAAFKLDVDGTTLLWKWQDGTSEYDRGSDVAIAEDGSVIIAGYSYGDFYGANAGVSGSTYSSSGTSEPEPDFAAIKLDSEGVEVWRWQDGEAGIDKLFSVAMTEDGCFVMAGYTSGVWDGLVSAGLTDFAAVKLDADGSEVWRWQDGTSGYDYLQAVVVQADGTILLGGHTSGYWDGSRAGGYDLAVVALDADGEEVWRWQGDSVATGGTTEDDFLYAMAADSDGRIILAGKTYGSWSSTNVGDGDFLSVMLDTDALATPSPTFPAAQPPSPSPTTAPPPAAAPTSPLAHTSAPSVSTLPTLYIGYAPTPAAAVPAIGYALTPAPTTVVPTTSAASPAPVSYPWPGQVDAAASTDEAGSNATIIAAGVSSAIVGVALIALGICLLKRRRKLSNSNNGTSSQQQQQQQVIHPPMVAVDGESDPSSLQDSLEAPSPPYLHSPAAAEAANVDGGAGDGDAISPFPAESVGLVQPGARPTTRASKNTVGGGGVAIVEGDTGLIAHAVEEGGGGGRGGVRMVEGDAEPLAHAVEDGGGGGGGGGVAIAEGDSTEPIAHYGKGAGAGSSGGGGGGGGGASIVGGDTEPIAHADKGEVGGGGVGGGVAVAIVEGDTDTIANSGKGAGVDARGSVGGGSGPVTIVGRDTEPTTNTGESGGGGSGGGGIGKVGLADGDVEGGILAESALTVTTSTANISTGEQYEFTPPRGERGVAGSTFVADEPKPTLDEIGATTPTNRPGKSAGLGLGQAVGDAAQELARNCQIPGVSEAATAVSILIGLVTDNRDAKDGTESSLRRCRSIVMMLQRAAKVLGKGGDTTGKAERAMMEDVHDAIFDLVELIQTYQSKHKLSQLLTSTLFRRRQDEMGAVVDRAILGLQLGLHVHVGNDVAAVKQDVGAFREGMHLYKGSMEEAQSKSLAETRRAKRQRKLDQMEIPEDHVTITDELLGKGGFGAVYLADYNGRNAAAKVMHISHDLGRRGENGILDGSTTGQLKTQVEKSQRKAFLRELDAMSRLRSPYTVNVYGAVTSLQDRLVIVMELLAGGDLRTLLGSSEQPLPEEQSRQIIGDICTGMAFLHSKEAIHGDLKSANVLLDGSGRAKIGDFGTSRWTQHTMSTALATFTTKSSKNTQMSLAWSAPEVLEVAGSTFASDVYSFGIVVWEVLSRELPWATVTRLKDFCLRVVVNDLRPAIPDGAPTEIADVARACWAAEPGDRPTFSAVMEGMKSNRWNV